MELEPSRTLLATSEDNRSLREVSKSVVLLKSRGTEMSTMEDETRSPGKQSICGDGQLITEGAIEFSDTGGLDTVVSVSIGFETKVEVSGLSTSTSGAMEVDLEHKTEGIDAAEVTDKECSLGFTV